MNNLPPNHIEEKEFNEEQIEMIELGEECGLTFTGETDDDCEPIFIGDDKAWALFNDGGI